MSKFQQTHFRRNELPTLDQPAYRLFHECQNRIEGSCDVESRQKPPHSNMSVRTLRQGWLLILFSCKCTTLPFLEKKAKNFTLSKLQYFLEIYTENKVPTSQVPSGQVDNRILSHLVSLSKEFCLGHETYPRFCPEIMIFLKSFYDNLPWVEYTYCL